MASAASAAMSLASPSVSRRTPSGGEVHDEERDFSHRFVAADRKDYEAVMAFENFNSKDFIGGRYSTEAVRVFMRAKRFLT